MTSEQIKKLGAAGLTIEQIAVVAEVMESEPRTPNPEAVKPGVHPTPMPAWPPGARDFIGDTGSWGTENR